MRQNDILNPQSVFSDEAPVAQHYMGQSAFAVIMACVCSLFILPIGIVLGLAASIAIFPDLAGNIDTQNGAAFMAGIAVAFAVTVIIVFWANKMRNYAMNIMGIVYLVGVALGFGVVAIVYATGGAQAFL